MDSERVYEELQKRIAQLEEVRGELIREARSNDELDFDLGLERDNWREVRKVEEEILVLKRAAEMFRRKE